MPIFREPCSIASAAVAALTGVTIFQQMHVLPDPLWAWLSLLSLLLVWYRRAAWPLLIGITGFLWAWFYAASVLSGGLATELEGQDVHLVGVVASVPIIEEQRTRFEFDVTRLYREGTILPAPRRVLLNWYYPDTALQAGDRWDLVVRLKRPHGLSNPGSFDYETWLFRHGIRATGYVRDQAEQRLLERPGGAQRINRLRQLLADAMDEVLVDHEFAGILKALSIGERAGITPQHWNVLTATGTSHLVAISGLHVGLVAGMMFFLVRAMWSRLPFLTLCWPAPKAGALAGIAAAGIYAALAGFSIPTQRALIMVTAVMGSVMTARATCPSQVLGLALLLVLVWDPPAVLEPGFWLSFGAVAIIFYGMGQRITPRGVWWRWGRVQVWVAIGLAPLLIILFQRVSLVSPFANLIAVPWVTLIVVPLALLGTLLLLPLPGLGSALLMMADGALGGLWPLLEYMAHSDIAQWLQAPPPQWAYIPALLGTLWLLAPAGMPGRWLGAVLLAPMLVVHPARPAPGEAWFTLLDVGQGLAAVVQTAGHTLVFDAGPASSERFNAGEAVIAPFLRHYGRNRIDAMIISHGDMDHRGGAAAILQAFKVQRLLTSVPDKITWTQGAVETCSAGQAWQWDGVRFELLYPFPGQPYRGNDASCVLRIESPGNSVLLPGDIERRSESALIEQYAERLATDILVAPHHGSNTSSTGEFLRAVQPRFTLFPVGYRNRYGFPKEEVVARYREEGAVMLDTAQDGAITFRLGSSGMAMAPESYRHQMRRYWHSH